MTFSVIVPMYNCERYIERCLQSITSQTYRDLELIAVDDSSVDGSLDKARFAAKSDPRIKLLAIPHGGAGAARNRGIEAASGEFVLFVDADDYWRDADFLMKLSEAVLECPADVYMFRSVKVTEDGRVLRRFEKPPFSRENESLSIGDVYEELVGDGQALASACNKCVRRRVLEAGSLRFLEDTGCEDIDWVLQLFSSISTICLLGMDSYAYTQHHTVSRSTQKDVPRDLAAIVERWRARLDDEELPHRRAVSGIVAFEYGICMGNYHLLDKASRRRLRDGRYLLKYGLDKKTKMIRSFCGVFGYRITCIAIRFYLWTRRIW